MKKTILSLAMVVATSVAFGQGMMGNDKEKKSSGSSSDTPMSLEGVLGFNGSSLQWSAPTLRFRYFVNENIAGRVQIGLGDGTGTPSSEMYTFYENGDGTGATGTQEISRSAWNAQIGGEYHMSATDRLSPYFMLGVNFGGGSYSETWDQFIDDSGFSGYVGYSLGTTASVDRKMSMFGIGAGAGVDFYLVENLYAGLELGLSYNSITYGDATVSVTTSSGGVSTTSTTVGGNAKESYLGTGATTAAFRLGWRF